MAPSDAETTRTLLQGRLPAVLRLAGYAVWWPVVHAADCCGQVLLLVRDDSELAVALTEWGPGRVPAAVWARDVPPLAGAPGRGRAGIAGRIGRLYGEAERSALAEFAQARPEPGLLDVGRGASLYRIEPELVRRDADGKTHYIDVEDYMEAWPDPLHPDERDLLVDLRERHAVRIGVFLGRRLAVPVDARLPLPVRVDRHGFTVDVADTAASRWRRLDFPRPVTNRVDLAGLLQPVLAHDNADRW
ncbi:DUF2470 domain-containing protein [Solwaraspora sp. WMMB335]|uniref:DUF2470 domain-containing protein n=1 Tax=Solwaraspora sp. WMMB335 TaxID=3404118 RepID=UPI003B963475